MRNQTVCPVGMLRLPGCLGRLQYPVSWEVQSGLEALQCSCSFGIEDLGRSKPARAVADGEAVLVDGEAIASCSLGGQGAV